MKARAVEFNIPQSFCSSDSISFYMILCNRWSNVVSAKEVLLRFALSELPEWGKQDTQSELCRLLNEWGR